MKKIEDERNLKFRSRKMGFTLLEILFGVSLFALALFPIMMVLAHSLTFGSSTNNRAIAMNEARRIIENIRLTADTSGLSAVVGMPTSQSGTSLPEEKILITNLSDNPLQNNADPLPIRVTIGWTEKGKATFYRVETMVTDR